MKSQVRKFEAYEIDTTDKLASINRIKSTKRA